MNKIPKYLANKSKCKVKDQQFLFVSGERLHAELLT